MLKPRSDAGSIKNLDSEVDLPEAEIKDEANFLDASSAYVKILQDNLSKEIKFKFESLIRKTLMYFCFILFISIILFSLFTVLIYQLFLTFGTAYVLAAIAITILACIVAYGLMLKERKKNDSEKNENLKKIARFKRNLKSEFNKYYYSALSFKKEWLNNFATYKNLILVAMAAVFFFTRSRNKKTDDNDSNMAYTNSNHRGYDLGDYAKDIASNVVMAIITLIAKEEFKAFFEENKSPSEVDIPV